MHTTNIGKQGERLAAKALTRAGYEVVKCNWKTKYAEIDIVACRNSVIYFDD